MTVGVVLGDMEEDSALLIVTVAGMVVDKTFSLVGSEDAIDKTCVSGPNATLVLGLLVSVADKALSCNIAILVFTVTTFVGSAPMDKEMDAFPNPYTGSSNIEVKVFGEAVFGLRLSATVVNFSGLKLMDNFTKET